MEIGQRVAIVTGAAGAIGKAVALRLSEEGVRVVVLDHSQEKVEGVAESIRLAGGMALPLVADIRRPSLLQAAVGRILAEWGQIDILVNCAGVGWHQAVDFHALKPEDWEWIIDVNVKGTLHCTHAVLEHMVTRRHGRIVNVSSIAAHVGIPRLAVYAASKAAMVAFSKSLAMELGPLGITVNCVSPGLVAPDEALHPTDGTFLGRRGRPSEIASVVVFLTSDEAAFVTGADYVVDGGRILGPRGA